MIFATAGTSASGKAPTAATNAALMADVGLLDPDAACSALAFVISRLNRLPKNPPELGVLGASAGDAVAAAAAAAAAAAPPPASAAAPAAAPLPTPPAAPPAAPAAAAVAAAPASGALPGGDPNVIVSGSSKAGAGGISFDFVYTDPTQLSCTRADASRALRKGLTDVFGAINTIARSRDSFTALTLPSSKAATSFSRPGNAVSNVCLWVDV